MPVVNPDLLSSEPILFRPPNFEDVFQSPTLRAIDQVLSHMKSPHYGISHYTDMEKLVHTAHMQDFWQDAGKAYVQLQVGY